MKINESKNRRMHIMQQISFRQKSRDKQRKSSIQRRRKIQQNLNDFMKTMSNVSFRNTGNSQGFKYPLSQNNGSYQQLPQEKQNLRKQYDQVLRSPSFKDINIGRQNESKLQQSKISQIKYHNQSGQKQKQNADLQIKEEEISYKYGQKEEKQIQKLTPKSIQNQSSASAIFFTSQFNQFISKNHLPSQQKLQHSHHKNENESNLIKQQEQQSSQLPNFSRSNQHINSPIKSPSKVQIVELQSKENKYINDHISENNNQLNLIPQTIQQQKKLTLLKNKSGHSLAFSNQSSLKYSLNQSNIKQILNHKFANQLIADTIQFNPSHQNSSLFHHLKFQILVQKSIKKNWKSFIKQFMLFIKVLQFSQKVQKRQKRMYFQAFIVNQQLNFQQKKYQIVCDKYLVYKQQKRLKQIFDFLKYNFLTVPKQKLQYAIDLQQNKQQQIKQKIFRCLKIAWYDLKVKKQIQMYYLSKLFSHFTRVLKTQKQIQRNKSLSFYCSNLKKRFFQHLKQGIDNLQNQRIQRDNAIQHYNFGLQRKVFDAWKDKLSYKDRYISLAMTTKNTFKQTTDQKWLQIKTVDFRQIK